MKVLHVAETISGGVASYLSDFDRVVCSDKGIENFYLVMESQVDELAGVSAERVLTYRSGSRGIVSFLFLSLAVYRAINNVNPDVVNFHSTFAGFFGRIVKVISRSRARVVYCAHGFSFIMDVSIRKKHLFAAVEKFLAKFTDKIVCISQYEYNQAVKYGLPSETMHVIPNGVDDAVLVVDDESPPFRNGSINCLFVGRWDFAKGLDILIEFFRSLDPERYSLYVVGGPVLFDNEIRNVPSNVHFLGWKPRALLDSYYRLSDLVIIPSRWDGFGLVAIEAMRNSTPVMVSDRGALPEVVDNGKAGVVFSIDDIGSFQSVLNSTSPEDWERIGKLGRQRYLTEYRSELMASRLLNLYKELCSYKEGCFE